MLEEAAAMFVSNVRSCGFWINGCDGLDRLNKLWMLEHDYRVELRAFLGGARTLNMGACSKLACH